MDSIEASLLLKELSAAAKAELRLSYEKDSRSSWRDALIDYERKKQREIKDQLIAGGYGHLLAKE